MDYIEILRIIRLSVTSAVISLVLLCKQLNETNEHLRIEMPPQGLYEEFMIHCDSL